MTNKRQIDFFLSAFSIYVVFNLSGCYCTPKPLPEYPSNDDVPQEESVEDELSLDDEDLFEEEVSAVTVEAAEPTPIEGSAPTLSIEKKSTLKKLKLNLNNWQLADAPGKHVHLIIDNQPYIAIRDISKPIDVLKLYEESFGEPLSKGKHVIRAFPSRNHHESVKKDSPFVMAIFSNGKTKEADPIDIKAPILTYSRPKGCNVHGQDVLLDFYIHNASLSEEGYRVKYTVDSEIEGEISVWKPHYIRGLEDGNHSISLQLIDSQSNIVPGIFNINNRNFEVKAACP